MTTETDDPALQEDFRRRALVAGAATGVCALVAALASGAPGETHFRRALVESWWSWPLQIATAAIALAVLASLLRRR